MWRLSCGPTSNSPAVVVRFGSGKLRGKLRRKKSDGNQTRKVPRSGTSVSPPSHPVGKGLGPRRRVIDSLIDRPSLSSDEKDYLNVLIDLVEAYEEEQLPDGQSIGCQNGPTLDGGEGRQFNLSFPNQSS